MYVNGYSIKRKKTLRKSHLGTRLGWLQKGHTQREGMDFNEIFSPLVKHSSIRIILTMVAHFDLHLEQMDVKTTFLHGKLEERILMS